MRKSFKVLLFALIVPVLAYDVFVFNLREIQAFNQKYILPHILPVKQDAKTVQARFCPSCQKT